MFYLRLLNLIPTLEGICNIKYSLLIPIKIDCSHLGTSIIRVAFITIFTSTHGSMKSSCTQSMSTTNWNNFDQNIFFNCKLPTVCWAGVDTSQIGRTILMLSTVFMNEALIREQIWSINIHVVGDSLCWFVEWYTRYQLDWSNSLLESPIIVNIIIKSSGTASLRSSTNWNGVDWSRFILIKYWDNHHSSLFIFQSQLSNF